MGKPLLGPSPVVIGTGLLIGPKQIDVLFIVQSSRDAVTDTSRAVRVFVGFEKHVFGIIPAGPVQHTDIERIQSQDPV
jgi:hypothetical protein